MSLTLADLRPYTSMTLARTKARHSPTKLVAAILDDIELVLGLKASEGGRTLVERGDPVRDGNWTVGFLHYEERRHPRWVSTPQLQDVSNELALVCSRRRHVAILLTDTSRARAVSLRFGEGKTGLGALEPITAGTLNAAFAGGPARTLWLSGIHTRTTVKPDSKVLMGADLRDALDPLGDQTYYFTAARCVAEVGDRTVPVGLAPYRSRVWTGPSRSWREFRDGVAGLLTTLDTVEKAKRSEDAPLPVLASLAPDDDEVSSGFDVCVIAPEMLADEVADADVRESLERWSYNASFDVRPTHGADLKGSVSLEKTLLGNLEIRVDLSDRDHVEYELVPKPRVGYEQRLQELVDLCSTGRWLQIRYESGHTLSGGRVYLQHFRDAPFNGWRFPNLSGVNITEEKPRKAVKGHKVFDPGLIGKRDSLFCWVWNNWPVFGATQRRGWLACDDGSMEIADFIHLDVAADPPLLSLIHVKGSGSADANRAISVSDYEVVTAQAVKNLRFLDRAIAADGLRAAVGHRIGSLVRFGSARQKNRDGFLAALKKVGAAYSRRVVIIQPRVSRQQLEDTRRALRRRAATGSGARLRQLDSLLLGAENSCRAVQAEFVVIGDGTRTARPNLNRPEIRKSTSRTPRGKPRNVAS